MSGPAASTPGVRSRSGFPRHLRRRTHESLFNFLLRALYRHGSCTTAELMRLCREAEVLGEGTPPVAVTSLLANRPDLVELGRFGWGLVDRDDADELDGSTFRDGVADELLPGRCWGCGVVSREIPAVLGPTLCARCRLAEEE